VGSKFYCITSFRTPCSLPNMKNTGFGRRGVGDWPLFQTSQEAPDRCSSTIGKLSFICLSLNLLIFQKVAKDQEQILSCYQNYQSLRNNNKNKQHFNAWQKRNLRPSILKIKLSKQNWPAALHVFYRIFGALPGGTAALGLQGYWVPYIRASAWSCTFLTGFQVSYFHVP